MTTTLRPMSTAEVLDRTFNLYRNHFLLFTGIAAGNALCLVLGVLLLVLVGIFPDFSSSAAPDVLGILMSELVLLLVALIGYTLAGGATIYAVSQVHLDRTATVRESYLRVAPLILRFIRIVVSIFLRMFGALMLSEFVAAFAIGLIVPALASAVTGRPSVLLESIMSLSVFGFIGAGLIWSIRIGCRNSLAVAACLLEKLPARQALKRSRWLTRKSLGRIFVVFLLSGLLGTALFWALLLPGVLLTKFIPQVALISWQSLAAFAAITLAFPIGTIAASLLYYDFRVRKEAFDLQVMMEAVSQPLPEQATAAQVSR